LTELEFHIRQTRHLIDNQPEVISISRIELSDDGAGGQAAGEPTALEPQTVRIIGILGTPRRMTSDGREVIVNKSVLGMPDLDIAVGDTFPLAGYDYEVVMVSREPTWRTIAEAAEHA